MIVTCDYCGNPAELVGGLVIYPHRPDLSNLRFWRCEPCRAYVGTHKNSRTHAPLGRLATAELRTLKMSVHARFDPLWKSGQLSRSAAYAKLAAGIGIEQRKCHIGMFDEARCRAALTFLSNDSPLHHPTTAQPPEAP